jgi:hypothetical protein
MKLIPMKSFVFLTILFTSLIHSQQTINGIVIDENNNPLVGASVLIRGTNQADPQYLYNLDREHRLAWYCFW